MEMFNDKQYLISGSNIRLLSLFSFDGKIINNNLLLHSDAITSISIKKNLNMFAIISKDGNLLLYILQLMLLGQLNFHEKLKIIKKIKKKKKKMKK